MNFRISDLKNFVEIANSRTMREGAEKIGISQPSLSESIKRLEMDLKVVLLYRSRSGISLTPGGHKTFAQAKDALTALGSLGANDTQNNQRLITLGCHPLIASYFLPQAFKIIQIQNPDYQIRLRHGPSRAIQLDVQSGKIDIGIVVNPLPSPDLIIKPLARDEIGIWLKKASAKNVFNKVFCNLDLLQTQNILRKWKHKPAHVVDTESLELIARFVNDGLGYGIIPARAASLLNIKECEKLDTAPTFQDTISIVYRPEFGKHLQEKFIIESLKQSVK